MRNIEMVDLKTQYQAIKPDIDKAIQDVLDSVRFINGKIVSDFAANLAAYLKVKHVIPCANGTDALQIALMGLDLQPGDEVITPSFTYVATVEVIALLKLRPVFVEVNTDTFTLDPASVEKAITPKTKAIVPVHLYGQTADMQPILDIAKKHNISIIEDNAQAIGAEYYFADGRKVKTATMGKAGCFSFFPSKNLGGYGDGGAICTNDDEFAAKLKMIVNHGQRVQYYHDTIGVNSRLDSMQAAILNVKLSHLDKYIDARRKAAAFYDKIFQNSKAITVPVEAKYGKHVYHQYTIKVTDRRNELQKYLADKKIPSMIYYPVPAHLQKAYSYYGFGQGDFPATEKLCQHVISLPMHTELDEEQLNYITESVLNFYN